MRRLLGLEDALSLGLCGPTHDRRSWTFDLDPGGVDPVLGIERLQDAYFARQPDYPRGITVPAIVDVPTGKVVTNDYAQITLDFSTEWTAFHRDGAPDLYPESLRSEIDEVADLVYRDVNNGVYRCGFAGSQDKYDAAFDRLFARLDWLEDRLTHRRYLVGDTITEPTSGCSRPSPDSIPSITVISSATGIRSPRSRHCGATRATCSRPLDSATRPISCRSSSTTTSSTPM